MSSSITHVIFLVCSHKWNKTNRSSYYSVTWQSLKSIRYWILTLNMIIYSEVIQLIKKPSEDVREKSYANLWKSTGSENCSARIFTCFLPWSKICGTVLIICRSQWLLLSGKAKQMQTTVEDLSAGGHNHSIWRQTMHFMLQKGGRKSRMTFHFLLSYISTESSSTRGGRNLSIHLFLEVFTPNLPALYRHLYRNLEMLADSRNVMVFLVWYTGGQVNSSNAACWESRTLLLLTLVLWELPCIFLHDIMLPHLNVLFP